MSRDTDVDIVRRSCLILDLKPRKSSVVSCMVEIVRFSEQFSFSSRFHWSVLPVNHSEFGLLNHESRKLKLLINIRANSKTENFKIQYYGILSIYY